jgi:hypothetical protein
MDPDQMFLDHEPSQDHLENRDPIRGKAICEMKEKWTVTLDLARASYC